MSDIFSKIKIKRSQKKNQDNSEIKREKNAKREKQIIHKGSVIRTKS